MPEATPTVFTLAILALALIGITAAAAPTEKGRTHDSFKHGLRNGSSSSKGGVANSVRQLLPHLSGHHSTAKHDSTHPHGCLGLSKQERAEQWVFQSEAPPCSISVAGEVVVDADSIPSGPSSGNGDSSAGGSESGSTGDESGSNESSGTSSGNDLNDSGGDGSSGTSSGNNGDSANIYTDQEIDTDGSDGNGSNGGSDGSDSSGSNGSSGSISTNEDNVDSYEDNGIASNGDGDSGEGNGNEDQDASFSNPLRYFNISDCGTFSNIWLWDLALTCESSDFSLEGCECTSANTLNQYGDFECFDACPDNCPVCGTCKKFLGCADEDAQSDRLIPKAIEQEITRALPVAIGLAALATAAAVGVSIYQYKKRTAGDLGTQLIPDAPPETQVL